MSCYLFGLFSGLAALLILFVLAVYKETGQ